MLARSLGPLRARPFPLAHLLDINVSELCAPDKLATALYPWWLYLPLAWASGELGEYVENADCEAARRHGISTASARAWFETVSSYLRQVAEGAAEHSYVGVPPEMEAKE